MAEYINREKAIETIQYRVCQGYGNKELICKRGSCAYCGIMEVMSDIESIDAADVQPVNQWISVRDRLPDEDGWYLVYKHNRVRVAEWCKDCWYNESDLPIDDCAITHWQPLPEPPKEGEHND